MAAGLVLRLPGVSIDDYDRVCSKLDFFPRTSSGNWPSGMLGHAAGMSDDGALIVIEFWDSRESQGRFMQERLGRALAEGGVAVVPEVTWLDLVANSTPPGG